MPLKEAAARALPLQWVRQEIVWTYDAAFYNLQNYIASPSSSAQSHSRALVTALRHWLRFLDQMYAGKVPPLELAEIAESLPVLGLVAVDASLITVDEYQAALERLVGSHGSDDDDEREAGRVALILGYRCGLRRKEAAGLSLCDFDSIDYLHVRANEMRILKTSNAKRDLPLRLLIPQKELDYVNRRVSEIQRRAGLARLKFDRAYLFSERRTPGKWMAFEKVVARIHAAFRECRSGGAGPIDETFHYHRLRHSFCNLMLLKLQPALRDMAFAFFRGEENQQTRAWIKDQMFRQNLFGTDRVKQADLQGIALLMGHGSAAVSLEHYTHVLDFYELASRPVTAPRLAAVSVSSNEANVPIPSGPGCDCASSHPPAASMLGVEAVQDRSR